MYVIEMVLINCLGIEVLVVYEVMVIGVGIFVNFEFEYEFYECLEKILVMLGVLVEDIFVFFQSLDLKVRVDLINYSNDCVEVVDVYGNGEVMEIELKEIIFEIFVFVVKYV